jgi:hypothetical protein
MFELLHSPIIKKILGLCYLKAIALRLQTKALKTPHVLSVLKSREEVG